MLFYQRTTGSWTVPADPPTGTGTQAIVGCYAGIGAGKNNIAMQDVHNVGPLPANVYIIERLMIHPPGDPLRHLGPCMRLTPTDESTMFGRSGFFIHLDNPVHPGMSSNGCIVPQNDSQMSGIAKLELLDKLVASGENRVTVQ